MPYISVIPVIRTIPGVERFDYAVDVDANIHVGDLIRVPFRRQQICAVIEEIKKTSAFADRTIHLKEIRPLLRFGPEIVELIARAARHTFVSHPTILDAWLHTVPKRFVSADIIVGAHGMRPVRSMTDRPTNGSTDRAPDQPANDQTTDRRAQALRPYDQQFLLDRWRDPRGLIPTTQNLLGRRLIVTPWRERANQLGAHLHAPVLHADLSDGERWSSIISFLSSSSSILITTRIGTWLGVFADHLLVDEPENDDHKQDELSPRLDARWIVEQCAEINRGITVNLFSTTPRLQNHVEDWNTVPTINLPLRYEIKRRGGLSDIQEISAATKQEIVDAIEEKTPVRIIHPIRGERARIRCSDCGWEATCLSCGFTLGVISAVPPSVSQSALCRRCGTQAIFPEACAHCHGTDLSRGRIGKDRLATFLQKQFSSDLVRVLDLADFQSQSMPRGSLVILTDASLLGGVTEDVRRKERLLIAWRRFTSTLVRAEARLIVQGSEETLTDCQTWLTSEGVKQTWADELAERKLFRYPPTQTLIKILINGPEENAQQLFRELQSSVLLPLTLRGPYPIPFRPKGRTPRSVIHLFVPKEIPEIQFFPLLEGIARRAIIDLDPINFFS